MCFSLAAVYHFKGSSSAPYHSYSHNITLVNRAQSYSINTMDPKRERGERPQRSTTIQPQRHCGEGRGGGLSAFLCHSGHPSHTDLLSHISSSFFSFSFFSFTSTSLTSFLSHLHHPLNCPLCFLYLLELLTLSFLHFFLQCKDLVFLAQLKGATKNKMVISPVQH